MPGARARAAGGQARRGSQRPQVRGPEETGWSSAEGHIQVPGLARAGGRGPGPPLPSEDGSRRSGACFLRWGGATYGPGKLERIWMSQQDPGPGEPLKLCDTTGTWREPGSKFQSPLLCRRSPAPPRARRPGRRWPSLPFPLGQSQGLARAACLGLLGPQRGRGPDEPQVQHTHGKEVAAQHPGPPVTKSQRHRLLLVT